MKVQHLVFIDPLLAEFWTIYGHIYIRTILSIPGGSELEIERSRVPMPAESKQLLYICLLISEAFRQPYIIKR